jgi:predicted RNA binding protein with dsRBD fold (UPF0201 family)
MTEIQVTETKKKPSELNSISVSMTVEFGDDPESVKAAIDKLVQLLKTQMSDDDVRSMLKKARTKLKKVLAERKAQKRLATQTTKEA